MCHRKQKEDIEKGNKHKSHGCKGHDWSHNEEVNLEMRVNKLVRKSFKKKSQVESCIQTTKTMTLSCKSTIPQV